MLSIARCQLGGVVAKPGIATGSRSNTWAKLEETRGSRVQLIAVKCRVRTDPFGPTFSAPAMVQLSQIVRFNYRFVEHLAILNAYRPCKFGSGGLVCNVLDIFSYYR